MKFIKSKLAVATTIALCFSGANAATISSDSVIVSLVKGGLGGESMLIDTQLLTGDFVNGSLTSWTSNTDLTAAINNFITGATSVDFWAVGRYQEGANKYAVSTTSLNTSQAVNALTDSNFDAFTSSANVGQFIDATEGLTENWKVGIPAGDASHFNEPNLLGNGLVASVDLGVDATFFATQSGFFSGVNNFEYDTWRLDTDGTLSYGVSAVPVPAAVWLFGSGLIGLVGVARRKSNLKQFINLNT